MRASGLRAEARQRLQAHLDQDPDQPWPAYYLGRLSSYRPEALDLARRARDGFMVQGDAVAALRARLSLILELDRQQRLDEAKAELADLQAQPLPAEDRFISARIGIVEAALLSSSGKLKSALDGLRAVEKQVVPEAPLELQGDCFYRLGFVFYELGRFSQAGHYFDLAARIYRDQGNLYRESASRYMAASMELAQAVGEEGRERITKLFAQALETAKAVGRRSIQAKAHLELGRLVQSDEAAHRHLESCLALEKELDPLTITVCLGALASRRAHEDPESSKELISRAIAMALAVDDAWTMVYLASERLAVSWATAPREQALDESLETLTYIEALRDLQPDDTSKAEVFSVWAEAYGWLAGRLLDSLEQPLRREHVEQAFEITERYRARVLLEKLQAANAWPAVTGARQEELRQRRVEIQKRMLTNPSGEDRAELRRIAEELARLDVRGAEASTTSAVLDPSTLAELERTLADDEALLSFQLAPWKDVYGRFAGGSWLFVVTRGGTRIYRLAGRAVIEPKITQYLGLFQSREDEAVAAESLYQELLQPALEELPEAVDKLAVVPDGILYLLPFGTLRPAAGEAALFARYQISVLPSATLWLHWRRNSRETVPGAALVLADPEPPDSSRGDTGNVERSWSLAGDTRLRRLPGAREEGQAILRFLGESSELRLDNEASESFVKQADLNRFSVVHVASHAVVHEHSPERSAVLLAAGSPGENGRLEMSEIVNLDLSGQLVVLSACDGASGNLLQGEGVMSLTRAFFQAGARTVVASLWRLKDDEARDLLVDIYRHLAKGQSVTAAVQAARRQANEDGKRTAAWAGIVVLGDGSLAPLSRIPAGSRWLLLAGIGLLIYLIVLGFRLWRRQRH